MNRIRSRRSEFKSHRGATALMVVVATSVLLTGIGLTMVLKNRRSLSSEMNRMDSKQIDYMVDESYMSTMRALRQGFACTRDPDLFNGATVDRPHRNFSYASMTSEEARRSAFHSSDFSLTVSTPITTQVDSNLVYSLDCEGPCGTAVDVDAHPISKLKVKMGTYRQGSIKWKEMNGTLEANSLWQTPLYYEGGTATGLVSFPQIMNGSSGAKDLVVTGFRSHCSDSEAQFDQWINSQLSTQVCSSADLAGGGEVARNTTVTKPIPNITEVDKPYKVVQSLYGLGAAVEDVKIADLDKDGCPDIIITDRNRMDGLITYLNKCDGTGTVKESPFINANFGKGNMELQIVDINGDGKLDVVSGLLDGKIRTSLGKGDGTFSEVVNTVADTATAMAHITALDLNKDGKTDLVTDSGFVYVGNGAGGFTLSQTFPVEQVGFYKQAVAFGDIDGDGYQDMAVSYTALASNPDPLSSYDAVFKGQADGTFMTIPKVNLKDRGGWGGLTLADVNNDGSMDIVSSRNIWLQEKDGSFSNPKAGYLTTAHIIGAHAIYAVDMDNDGTVDLVSRAGTATSATGRDGFTVYKNTDGQGTYSAPIVTKVTQPDEVNTSIWSEAIGDLNNDGLKDIVTGDIANGIVSISIQRPVSGPLGSPSTSNVMGKYNEQELLDMLASTNTNVTTSMGIDSRHVKKGELCSYGADCANTPSLATMINTWATATRGQAASQVIACGTTCQIVLTNGEVQVTPAGGQTQRIGVINSQTKVLFLDSTQPISVGSSSFDGREIITFVASAGFKFDGSMIYTPYGTVDASMSARAARLEAAAPPVHRPGFITAGIIQVSMDAPALVANQGRLEDSKTVKVGDIAMDANRAYPTLAIHAHLAAAGGVKPNWTSRYKLAPIEIVGTVAGTFRNFYYTANSNSACQVIGMVPELYLQRDESPLGLSPIFPGSTPRVRYVADSNTDPHL